MKKYSNVSGLGAKSIHYNNDTVYIEDSSSKKTNLLFACQFGDIENLEECKNVAKLDDSTRVKLEILPNKKGFALTRKVKDKTIKAIIKSVKRVSYVQSLLNLSGTNNFQIQIYSNFEDMKKLITTYFNNVLYTMNSVYRDISGDDNFIFDKIGSIPVNIDYFAFLEDNRQEREKWEKVYLPNFEKVLNRFGIKTEKSVQVNYIKCLQYIAHRCGKEIKSVPKLNEKIQRKLDVFLSDPKKKKHLLGLALTSASKLYPEAKNFTLYNYFFRDKRIEKIILDKLSQDPILQTLETPIDPNGTTFNYIRLLSGIRQFVVHNKQKIRIENNTFVNDNAKRDVADFSKRFAKNNHKYFCILKELFTDEDILDKYYEYTIFDDSRNINVSIDKLQKEMFRKIDFSQDVTKEKLSEHLNTCKTLAKFIITNYLKKNTDKLSEIINNLKESRSEEDKEKVYGDYAGELLILFNDFKSLRGVAKKYLGKVNDSAKFDFYPKTIIENQSIFLNSIYVMSKFLTVKESRNMFSKLLNKYESIKSLLELAEFANVEIYQNDFKSHKMLFVIDGSKIVEENPKLQNDDIDIFINQLKLMKGIRTRERATEINFSNELERIFQLFKSDITFEEFAEQLELDEAEGNDGKPNQKPLKSYLKNDVFMSKQFQYISNFSSTEVCRQLLGNREIIRFVIENMIDKSNKDCKSMSHYLARIYHDFKGEKVDASCLECLLTKEQIAELVDEVYSLSLEKISDTLFNKTDKNHKVLVKLYLNICYLLVKNIINQNSSYLVQIQDYESLYKIVHDNPPEAIYDMSVVNHFIENSPNKDCGSYRQLVSLLGRDYIKEFLSSEAFDELTIKYRNTVVHSSLLNELMNSGYDFGAIKNVTSYFALYQSLLQALLEKVARRAWGENYDKYFVEGNDKPYSTKLCIALNIPYAYNISRFNNNTIEKYATKKLL